jgi:hypothetical protein
LGESWKLVLKILVLLFGVLLLFYYSSSHGCSFENRHCHKFFNCDEKYVVNITDEEVYDNDNYYIKSENDDEALIGDAAKLNLTASAGKLTFAPGKSLFSVEKNESSKYYTTKINKNSNRKKTEITAKFTPVKNFTSNSKKLIYNVFLSETPVWEIELELNATADEIDLCAFKVKELQIEANASAVDLKLGNLYDSVEVDIKSNASSVKINLPKDMKCIINKDNALSSMNIHGLKKQKDGSYLSEDDAETVGTIYISVAANVSSVEIGRYE